MGIEGCDRAVFSELPVRQALAERERERDAYFLHRDPIWHDRLDWQAHTFRHLVHFLPGETILDIGAGEGLFVDALRRVSRGQNQVTALTFNDMPRTDCRGDGVEWIAASAADVLGSRTFDYVIVHNML